MRSSGASSKLPLRPPSSLLLRWEPRPRYGRTWRRTTGCGLLARSRRRVSSRLRAAASCTRDQWWPRMSNMGYARGDRGEVVYCTPGTREYHQHASHRQETHPKSSWKLARVVWLAWQYLYHSGSYDGRGG